MPVNSSRGQTLISLMISVGLIAIIALFAATAVGLISKTLRSNDDFNRLVDLDTDVSNLLVIPPLCSCNLRQFGPLRFKVPNSIFQLKELRFFANPLTCANPDPKPIVQVGTEHEASRQKILAITLGPFYPLGDSGNYLANLTIGTEGSHRPLELKIPVYTKTLANGDHEIDFCGISPGVSPAKAPQKYSDRFYRFSQFSLNEECKDIPSTNPLKPIEKTPHAIRVEPYVFTRNQYFWPAEEGDMISEYESTRIAGTPIAPNSFSSFSAATICFEENGVGDNVQLLVPARNTTECGSLKKQFLEDKAKVIDVGFSVVDNCISRFF